MKLTAKAESDGTLVLVNRNGVPIYSMSLVSMSNPTRDDPMDRVAVAVQVSGYINMHGVELPE